MYLGLYPSTCNKKNQLILPVKFRKLTGSELLIAHWFEKSLIVLPYTKAEEILDKVIENGSSLLPEVRDLERFFYGSAVQVTLDEKSRFVLPKELRDYAGIGKKVAFVGVRERIELWDSEIYQNYGKIREVQIRETALQLYNRINKNTQE